MPHLWFRKRYYPTILTWELKGILSRTAPFQRWWRIYSVLCRFFIVLTLQVLMCSKAIQWLQSQFAKRSWVLEWSWWVWKLQWWWYYERWKDLEIWHDIWSCSKNLLICRCWFLLCLWGWSTQAGLVCNSWLLSIEGCSFCLQTQSQGAATDHKLLCATFKPLCSVFCEWDISSVLLCP